MSFCSLRNKLFCRLFLPVKGIFGFWLREGWGEGNFLCLPQFLSGQGAKNALNLVYGKACYTAETKPQSTDLWSVRLGHVGISESFHICINFRTTPTRFLQLKFRKILWKISAPFDSTPGISIESWLIAKKR